MGRSGRPRNWGEVPRCLIRQYDQTAALVSYIEEVQLISLDSNAVGE